MTRIADAEPPICSPNEPWTWPTTEPVEPNGGRGGNNHGRGRGRGRGGIPFNLENTPPPAEENIPPPPPPNLAEVMAQ